METLREVGGVEAPEWRVLSHGFGEQWAFAAFGLAELREVRSVVALHEGESNAAIVYRHEGEVEAAPVDSLDFAGARWRDWFALFHAEKASARGAVSFRAESSEPAHFLVTGLAPGHWEVWRNGWIEETGWHVEPGKGLLEWRGKGGSFFLRRLA